MAQSCNQLYFFYLKCEITLLRNVTFCSHDDSLSEVKPKDDDSSSVAATVDLILRDQILEMEEKIFIGNLGTLKCRDRATWQEAIKEGGYDSQVRPCM